MKGENQMLQKNNIKEKISIEDQIKFINWLNKHNKELSKYYGKWVAIELTKGIVAFSENLSEVENIFKKKYPHKIPFLHLVPHKDEGTYVLCIFQK